MGGKNAFQAAVRDYFEAFGRRAMVCCRAIAIIRFSSPFDLHRFPFDQQTFKVVLKSHRPASEVIFLPNKKFQTNVEWCDSPLADRWTVRSSRWELPTLISGKGNLYPSLEFRIRAERKQHYFIMNHILIQWLIVAVSCAAFDA